MMPFLKHVFYYTNKVKNGNSPPNNMAIKTIVIEIYVA